MSEADEIQNIRGVEKKTTIKDWPESERPRERLLAVGTNGLTDSELLAVILRSGFKGKDAVALSRELITTFGGLRGLLSAGYSDLCKIKGLGPAKIAVLLAAIEIARRRLREEIIGKNVVRDPQSVFAYLMASLRDHKKEVFKVVYLNKGNRVLDEQDLFQGTVDETVVHTREVVKSALDRHATALILVHNHPSGRIQPSQEDIRLTQKLQQACSAVSIQILDHMIIGDNQYFSFREQGIL